LLKIDLNKSFNTSQRVTNIICKGEFKTGLTSAIYGRSGVGKSTILRIISGLEKADSGNIYFNEQCWFDSDKNINIPICDRKIGFVFQDFNLFPTMTVEENLKYASGKMISEETKNLLNATGLKKLLKSYPRDLSGGEKQRVSIVRALCQKPELLLLDEPFSALDDESIGDLIREIKLIQNEFKTTVIMVSHRKDVIHAMANSVIYMRTDGTVNQGDPLDLLKKSF
jgi:molybdate transport system ATP-binding protein